MVMVGGEDGGGEVNMEMGRCEGALSDGRGRGRTGWKGVQGMQVRMGLGTRKAEKRGGRSLVDWLGTLDLSCRNHVA